MRDIEEKIGGDCSETELVTKMTGKKNCHVFIEHY